MEAEPIQNRSTDARSGRVATGNRILDALPDEEFRRLSPHFERTHLAMKEVLFHVGDKVEFLYFPLSFIFAAAVMSGDGSLVEVGASGNEGLVGLSAFLGCSTWPRTGVVEGEGEAIRVPAQVLLNEFKRAGRFHDLVLQYAELCLEQVAQTSFCNRRHKLASRLARWLLLQGDRLRNDEFIMTHEFLAMLLGAPRPSVTTAARQFQHAGILQYRRGQIRILDRAKLEARSCKCHLVLKNMFDSFLPEATGLGIRPHINEPTGA
jgi:CRP-like cAMP-binding protein